MVEPAKLREARGVTLRRAWTFVRPERLKLAVYLVLALVTAALVVLPPLVFKLILDDALPRRSYSELRIDIVLLTALALGNAAAVIGGQWLGASISTGVIVRMRSVLFDHLQRMSIGFFTRIQGGKLQSQLTQDINQANQLFSSTLTSLVQDVFVLALTIVFMAQLSILVTGAALVLASLFLIASEAIGQH